MSEPLAFLPWQPLNVAASFACKDDYKPTIQNVRARQKDDQVIIDATNGVAMIRVAIPCDAGDGLTWHTSRTLCLSGKALTKKVAYGAYASVKPELLEVWGGKRSRTANHPPTTTLQAFPWDPSQDPDTFPNLDQLWPESFNNEPKAQIGLGCDVLVPILNAAKALSDRGMVRMQTNAPNQPLLFTCDCDVWGCSGATVEMLLMPVLIRN